MTKQGPLSGQTIGEKYVLGELLGEGGFGVVYKAQHLHLQRLQALKILLERHFQKSEFRERFLHEAQTVATLDHPNIIHLDDFGIESARAYLVGVPTFFPPGIPAKLGWLTAYRSHHSAEKPSLVAF